jgi:hypothetical protein
MSLLASDGIGVFKNRHFGVNASNSVVMLESKDPTHEFVWDCLKYWASRPESSALFSAMVKPYGRSLDEWLLPLGGAAVVAPQARDWFQQWGMDLKILPEDRDARNVSSYRPDGLPDMWRVNSTDALTFASEAWMALEPSPGSSFDQIDRQILRIVLEGIFRGRTASEPMTNRAAFEAFLNPVVDYQGYSPEARADWIRFMNREIIPLDLTIFRYSSQSSEVRFQSEFAIISRAMLLLRIASGSIAQLLSAAGFSAESLAFWWIPLGTDRGLWNNAPSANQLYDMWADVARSLEDVEAFQGAVAPADQSFFRITNELAGVMTGFNGCERVAIWNMST